MTHNDKPKHGDDALERLGDLQRLGQALFEREAGRLARKHGVDDPRAQRFIRAARGSQQTLTALEVSRDARPQNLRAEQDETVVYGRVSTSDRRSVANVEVMIEDTGGRVQRAAGSSSTDAGGRYSLRIQPAVAAKLAGKEYILTVRNSRGDVIYRAASTLKLELSQALQVDVDLGQRVPPRRPSTQPRSRPPIEEPEQPEQPIRPVRPTKPVEPVVFKVSGLVLSSERKPVSGVLVRIYDKDRQYDDLLGAALTNRKGEFSARYRFQDFSEGEATADLFFVVLDADEQELLSTADQVRFNADRETIVTLTLPS
ncbi:MAG: hypothetical protein JOZ51_04985 [Chloroflexi bacterium]|nr:hypothetical protein [Chloroflexota bacterium]